MTHLILTLDGELLGSTEFPDECGVGPEHLVLPAPADFDPEFPEALVLEEGTLRVDELSLLAALKQRRMHEVDLAAKARRDVIVSAYSAAEMASWSIKRAEALQWQATQLNTDAPALVLEAQIRGVSLADLVTKVLDKSTQLTQLEAAIAGYSGYLQDQIRTTTTLAEVRAIDINAGWPA